MSQDVGAPLKRISKRAVRIALEYEESQGRVPHVVGNKRVFTGFDIVSLDKRGKIVRTIEVKGTKKQQSIPDFSDTEFTPNLRPIASYIYVVGNLGRSTKPVLYEIPRSAVKKEHVTMVHRVRFRSSFAREVMPRFRK